MRDHTAHEMIAAPLTDLVISGNHHAAVLLVVLHIVHMIRIHVGH